MFRYGIVIADIDGDCLTTGEGVVMSRRARQLCLWSGPAFMAVFLFGFWVIAGLVPPPSPHDSALKIAHLYQQNTNGIRLGLLITMIAAALSVPFGALIAVHMKRI